MTENMKDRQERGRTSNFIPDGVEEKIRVLRKTGLSQLKVATIVGCSQMHISKLERGKYKLKGKLERDLSLGED
ncbi:helix-turn-helix domain-containing protein, partial [Herbiconiux daphne]